MPYEVLNIFYLCNVHFIKKLMRALYFVQLFSAIPEIVSNQAYFFNKTLFSRYSKKE